MTGELGILNVGAGDTKLTFDNKNPAETIRACRIVRDMLRRGYALLIEVDQPDGTKAYQRAWDFDEARAEYIVADFDESYAMAPPSREQQPASPSYVPPPRYGAESETETDREKASETPSGDPAESAAEAPAPRASTRGRPRGTKRVAASSTRAVAVARSAGG